jgi:hypothetical protein
MHGGGMKEADLLRQLEREIKYTEKSLAFWTDQVRLQARLPSEGATRNVAKSYEQQLQRLRNARRVFKNA